MAALPYMPLYVADYLADAAHLSTVQHGAYLLLIMNYWQRGEALPDDDVRLARIARMTAKEWGRHKDVLREFFSVDENLWRHRRIDSELARVASKSLKSKKAAQASVERRFSDRSTSAQRSLNHTDTETDTQLDKSNCPEVSSDKQFWDSAKSYLGGKSSLIGKWVRDHGKAETAKAITAAQIERAVDPVQFIQGYFRKSGSRPVEMPC